ncbi:MAG: type II toxin-antitoxin system HicA family toxin [Chloroflexota bacterium]
MKRRDLLRHLEEHGCEQLREGSRHTVIVNPSTKTASTVPRHTEINSFLARKICRDLRIPLPERLG